MTEQRSLHRKLAQVMYEAERIPKNGTAPDAMGGYKFVQVGDAADHIRKALAEKVITMMPVGVSVVGQVDRPTKGGGNMTTVDLVTTWRLTDGESGEYIEIQSFGAGADTGDKYSGKATTSAMKYALLAGFLLSTGEDSEAGNLPAQLPRGERNLRAEAADHEPTPGPGSLIGIVEAGKAPADFELREEAEKGWTIGFRLVEGRKSVKVLAFGDLAGQIAALGPALLGQRATCYGVIGTENWTPPGKRTPVTFQVLTLERLTSGDIALPLTPAASEGSATEPADEPEAEGTTGVPDATVEAGEETPVGGARSEPASTDPRAVCGAPSVYNDVETCGKPPHTSRVNHASYDAAGKVTGTW